MLPELHACQEAEDFFEALEVPFDPAVLAAHRLPLLKRFGEVLVEVVDRHPATDEPTLRALVRAALQELHGAARLGRPLGGRVTATSACVACALSEACAPAEPEGWAEERAGR